MPATEKHAPRLVLASGSPRRALLLRAAGYSFDVRIPAIDETLIEGEPPAEMVLRLSHDKATAISTPDDVAVLAADTTVVLDGRCLGKPADAEEAVTMLQGLVGRTHSVLTGWTIRLDRRERFSVAESVVAFHQRTEAELRAYVERTNPIDKAGAYALQGDGGWLVEAVQGSRANVMGLPIGQVASALDDLGIVRSAPESG